MCGSLIVYQSIADGKPIQLGTSGFLYRANKLMYDHKTMSLWSTLQGKPVVGPLVGRGIELQAEHVVTTTWGEWAKRHPKTQVLDINTRYDRDYDEGVAYRDYFATDALKYDVPQKDSRLKNKAEVLAIRYRQEQLAIDVDYLAKNRILHEKVGGQTIVVLTDSADASRVYAITVPSELQGEAVTLLRFDGDQDVIDDQGRRWRIEESSLVCESDPGLKFERFPAHRAFWFGWYAQFPETRLLSL